MGQDLSFLEDETLTDNMEDALAKKILRWLENIAHQKPEHQDRMIKFVRHLNSQKNNPEIEEDDSVLIELFEMALDFTDDSNSSLIYIANFILTIGEKNEPKI